MRAVDVQERLRSEANAEVANQSAKFFKTGPGEYGEHDQFIGVRVPVQRKISKAFRNLPLSEVEALLQSPVHEDRLVALFIMVLSVSKPDERTRKQVYDCYVRNMHQVNNWDLVDSSAPAIVGGYLFDKSRKPLMRWAKSKLLWERRIAILSTHHFIRKNDFEDTLSISHVLLNDKEDLIHKAVGWMLREVGVRSMERLLEFLEQHCSIMPRTMLRYAIEHLDSDERKKFMNAKPTSQSKRKH